MAEKQSEAARLGRELLLPKKVHPWFAMTDGQRDETMALARSYIKFASGVVTERDVVDWLLGSAGRLGFKNFDPAKKLEPGDRVILTHKGKAIACVIIGKNRLDGGLRIIGAHGDSPHLDLKYVPLDQNEQTGLTLAKTHYYGGIKKYQWLTLPLAITGVVVKKGGEEVKISIGLDPDDPVFTIADLLIHLDHRQAEKKVPEAFPATNLQLLMGSHPLTVDGGDEEKDSVKIAVLQHLNERYGIVEGDLMTADLQVVPAIKPRFVGVDRSMIGGFGHDDRSNVFAGFEALSKIVESGEIPEHTAMLLVVDREEIGSVGPAAMKGPFFPVWIEWLKKAVGCKLSPKEILLRSKAVSADVGVAVNPLFLDRHDLPNAGRLGFGMLIARYTGAKGKAGANEADVFFTREVCDIFTKAGVPFQMAMLGDVDVGGGGTIAMFQAAMIGDVIDAGVGVIAMHSPFEVIAVTDLYFTGGGYYAFLTA